MIIMLGVAVNLSLVFFPSMLFFLYGRNVLGSIFLISSLASNFYIFKRTHEVDNPWKKGYTKEEYDTLMRDVFLIGYLLPIIEFFIILAIVFPL